MKGKTGFFQDEAGNDSSSRLGSFIVIMYALILATAILIFGYLEGSKVIVTAASSGTIFVTIAGPAMVYMFNQKREEKKKQPD